MTAQEQQETPSMDDIVHHNNFLLNGLIDVLVKKGVITEEELEQHLDSLTEE